VVEQLHGGPQSPAHSSGNARVNPELRLIPRLAGQDRSALGARTTDKGFPTAVGEKIQSSPSINPPVGGGSQGVSEGVGRRFNPDHRLNFCKAKIIKRIER